MNTNLDIINLNLINIKQELNNLEKLSENNEFVQAKLAKLNKCCEKMKVNVDLLFNSDDYLQKLKPFEYYKEFDENLSKYEYEHIKDYIINHTIENIEIDDYLNVNCKDCKNCKLCVNCENCRNCIGCYNCDQCYHSEKCINCSYQSDQSRCINWCGDDFIM